MENYVAQVLKTKGYKELFFYEKRDPKTFKTIMEIDFLTIANRRVAPIEVNSSDDFSISSLQKFKKAFDSRVNHRVVIYPVFALDWCL